MNIQSEFDFSATGGFCSAPPGVCAPPVQAGGGTFRVCKKCGKSLPLSKFYEYTRKNGRPKIFYSCKKCWNEYIKIRTEKYPERKKEQVKRWATRNKERLAESNKRWAVNNKHKIKMAQKKYCDNNKGRRKENHAKWARNNREKFLEMMRVSARKRYAKSKNYRLAIGLRVRLRDELKKSGAKKQDKSLFLLGCSIKEFRKYIESLFLPGMSWDNHSYRGWHLDHIRPVSSFDLSCEEQQRACFHYTNYQPLWAADNMAKSAKII